MSIKLTRWTRNSAFTMPNVDPYTGCVPIAEGYVFAVYRKWHKDRKDDGLVTVLPAVREVYPADAHVLHIFKQRHDFLAEIERAARRKYDAADLVDRLTVEFLRREVNGMVAEASRLVAGADRIVKRLAELQPEQENAA